LSDEFLIFTRQGIDIEQYPAIQRHLEKFRTQLEPKPDNWDNKVQGKWLGRKSGTYKWHEIQDTTAYHEEFEQPKIYWAEIAKLPRFSWDDQKLFASNKAHMLIPPSKAVLAFLNSRVAWFVLSQICVPLRLRAGLWQYQLTQQFVKRVPVPDLTDDQESQLAQIGEHITALSSERYLLHESMRHDIREIGQGIELNRPLREWWNLKDTMQFQREVERAETSIPVRQLAEWRDHLASQQAQHNRLTAQIVDLETRLNAIVYQAFDLDEAEIRLIEENTRYPYGAV
jgi:hypothetical protein